MLPAVELAHFAEAASSNTQNKQVSIHIVGHSPLCRLLFFGFTLPQMQRGSSKGVPRATDIAIFSS